MSWKKVFYLQGVLKVTWFDICIPVGVFLNPKNMEAVALIILYISFLKSTVHLCI